MAKEFIAGLVGKNSGVGKAILGASGKAIGGAFQAIGSLFGGRKRRRRERAARKDYTKRLGNYGAFDITNPYDNMQNPFESITNELNDLQVSTEAADFEAQQMQQGLAQSLSTFRGAGGGSGVASLATALAQEQRRSMQGIAANIAQQEVANTRLARQADMDIQRQTATAGLNIQQLEAAGESTRQERELDRKGDMLGIAASELEAARGARQQATSDLFGGLGKMFGGD